MRHAARFVALLGIAAVSLPLHGCVTNAATGRTQLNALSRDEEIALGTEAGPQLAVEYGGVY
ncbi:MAG: M48 family peptidase, partial [Phycisphaerales bacterium]|nr:M48 family peptidase [Phycisphaerales bacterium]